MQPQISQPLITPRPPLWLVVFQMVAAHFGMTREHLTGPRRDRRTVHARWAAIWLLHRHGPMQITTIGRRIRRDHTTVIHALRNVDALAHDAPLRGDIATLEARLLDYLAGRGMADPTAVTQRTVDLPPPPVEPPEEAEMPRFVLRPALLRSRLRKSHESARAQVPAPLMEC